MAALLWKGRGPGTMRVRIEETLARPVTVEPWDARWRAGPAAAVLDVRGLRGAASLRTVNDWMTRASAQVAQPTLVMLLGRPPAPLGDDRTRDVLAALAATRAAFELPVPFEEAICAALELWRAPLVLNGGRLNFLVLPDSLEDVTFRSDSSSAAAADLLCALLSPVTRALQGQLLTVDGGLGPLGLTFGSLHDGPALPPELEFVTAPVT